MHYSIRIAGPAGLGMHSVMDIIASVFVELGYQIITDSEYQSIIKGGINYFDVHIHEGSPYITREVDACIALNDKNLIAILGNLKKWGTIFAAKKWIDSVEKTHPDIRTEFRVIEREITDKYENTYLIGMLGAFLGLDASVWTPSIEKSFRKKGEALVESNLAIVRLMYEEFSGKGSDFQPNRIGSPGKLSYGNKMIALGAIDSGLDYFSAYPMTPASTILSEVVNSGKVPFLQAEDEIAVMNSALGAAYTWARAMVGTSWGGFALMTEALSFAHQAEIGVVAVLSQRAGPSTGTPTFHEQGEILYALRPTFGDSENIVLCPSTLEEGYTMAGQALNYAQKYQMPIIYLTDKQFSEGKVTIDSNLKPTPIDRGKLETAPTKEFKRYALTEDGVSPYVTVGTPDGDFIATSYEHDEAGETTEDMDMKMRMTEKRARKLKDFFQKEGIAGFRFVNPEAKKMILTLSFASYTATAFVEENPEYGLIIVQYLYPLDSRLRDLIVSKEEVVFFESNYSGQLESYLTKEFGLLYVPTLKISHRRRYDLLPFYMEDFNALRE